MIDDIDSRRRDVETERKKEKFNTNIINTKKR